MNIQDALKETGAAIIEGLEGWIHWNSLDSCFYMNFNHGDIRKYSLSKADIEEDNWLPYHEEKEIRPEKAGELWRYNSGVNTLHYHTDSSVVKGESRFKIILYGFSGEVSNDPDHIIHHKNGWTRLFPPVEDESVERIEIEGVRWYSSPNDKHGAIPGSSQVPGWARFIDTPPMKMILEIMKKS